VPGKRGLGTDALPARLLLACNSTYNRGPRVRESARFERMARLAIDGDSRPQTPGLVEKISSVATSAPASLDVVTSPASTPCRQLPPRPTGGRKSLRSVSAVSTSRAGKRFVHEQQVGMHHQRAREAHRGECPPGEARADSGSKPSRPMSRSPAASAGASPAPASECLETELHVSPAPSATGTARRSGTPWAILPAVPGPSPGRPRIIHHAHRGLSSPAIFARSASICGTEAPRKTHISSGPQREIDVLEKDRRSSRRACGRTAAALQSSRGARFSAGAGGRSRVFPHLRVLQLMRNWPLARAYSGPPEQPVSA